MPRSAGIYCGVARDHAAPCGQDKLQGGVLSGSSWSEFHVLCTRGSASGCEGHQDAGTDGVEGAAGSDLLGCVHAAQLLSCVSNRESAMIQVT